MLARSSSNSKNQQQQHTSSSSWGRSWIENRKQKTNTNSKERTTQTSQPAASPLCACVWLWAVVSVGASEAAAATATTKQSSSDDCDVNSNSSDGCCRSFFFVIHFGFFFLTQFKQTRSFALESLFLSSTLCLQLQREWVYVRLPLCGRQQSLAVESSKKNSRRSLFVASQNIKTKSNYCCCCCRL